MGNCTCNLYAKNSELLCSLKISILLMKKSHMMKLLNFNVYLKKFPYHFILKDIFVLGRNIYHIKNNWTMTKYHIIIRWWHKKIHVSPDLKVWTQSTKSYIHTQYQMRKIAKYPIYFKRLCFLMLNGKKKKL